MYCLEKEVSGGNMNKKNIHLEFVCGLQIPEDMLTFSDFTCPIVKDGRWFNEQKRKKIRNCSIQTDEGIFRCKCKDF